jgi:hypothetical protein
LGSVEIVADRRRTAGPSAALRSAQDDRFEEGLSVALVA